MLRNPKSLGWAREVALKRIEEQCEASDRALRKYGTHLAGCAVRGQDVLESIGSPRACTCGFAAATCKGPNPASQPDVSEREAGAGHRSATAASPTSGSRSETSAPASEPS